jgi:cholesterol transport system auxiliary component
MQKQGARFRRLLASVNGVLLLALPVLSSCVNLAKSNPERQYYALDVTRQAGDGAPVAGTVLEVRRFVVSPAFQGQELVYRTDDTRYESDFYNQWFVPPSTMLTQQVQNWLINAQLFEHVVAASSYIEATHRLEGTVTDLYGDYRQKDRWKAVVGIRMVLIEITRPGRPFCFNATIIKWWRSPATLLRGSRWLGIKASNRCSWRLNKIFGRSIWGQTIKDRHSENERSPGERIGKSDLQYVLFSYADVARSLVQGGVSGSFVSF